MLKKLFTEHPASVDETYFEHLRFASSRGFQIAYSGLACMIHAILPFLFIKTGSNTICELYEEMRDRNNGIPTKNKKYN